MAKYRRYRNYNRRNRSRWSPNIAHQIGRVTTFPPTATVFDTITLAFNPVQENTTVSQTFTVKNVEFNGVFETPNSVSTIENLVAYIMFVPQGMSITASYDIDHPEYIMALKYYGTPTSDTTQNFQPLRVKTRLSRKLNTGDAIVLYLKGYNVGQTTVNLEYSGVVRWWTKAN